MPSWHWPRPDQAALTFVILILVWLLIFSKRNQAAHAPDSGYRIAEAIMAVKAELQRADSERRKNNEAALFRVETFDLELNFVVKANQQGNAGVDLKVVNFGGTASSDSERAQKIVLHFKAEPDREGAVEPSPNLPFDP